MSKVALTGNASGTGTLTVAAPNTNSDYTLTLPESTGTVATEAYAATAGEGPLFRATKSATQALTANVAAKIVFDTEEADTNGNYDPTTNYRFTPTVAGWYLVFASIGHNGTAANNILVTQIYKSGSIYSSFGQDYSTGNGIQRPISGLIYCNGSTDYIEIYGVCSANCTINSSTVVSYFSAVRVRGA
jgi:hypothetical protein